MMHLAVDVGNTETVIGLFTDETLEVSHHWRYATTVRRTSDELRLLYQIFLGQADVSPDVLSRTVVGSVVPAQLATLLDALDELGAGRVVVLDGPEGLPVRLDVEEPRTVGADRIANTLAAAHLYQRDVIVVDLGTATTYDCIGSDGVFHGGVIAPGLQSGQEWLGGRTAKLPLVAALKPPSRVIGRRTEACLQSGLFYSAVDAIDGMVTRIQEEWGRGAVEVVATGGHATSVAPHTRTLGHVEPHLTLIGLALAGHHLREAES